MFYELANSHPLLEEPKPISLRIKYIGGIGFKPAKNITPEVPILVYLPLFINMIEYSSILSSVTRGAVLISFGSQVEADAFPSHVVDAFVHSAKVTSYHSPPIPSSSSSYQTQCPYSGDTLLISSSLWPSLVCEWCSSFRVYPSSHSSGDTLNPSMEKFRPISTLSIGSLRMIYSVRQRSWRQGNKSIQSLLESLHLSLIWEWIHSLNQPSREFLFYLFLFSPIKFIMVRIG